MNTQQIILAEGSPIGILVAVAFLIIRAVLQNQKKKNAKLPSAPPKEKPETAPVDPGDVFKQLLEQIKKAPSKKQTAPQPKKTYVNQPLKQREPMKVRESSYVPIPESIETLGSKEFEAKFNTKSAEDLKAAVAEVPREPFDIRRAVIAQIVLERPTY